MATTGRGPPELRTRGTRDPTGLDAGGDRSGVEQIVKDNLGLNPARILVFHKAIRRHERQMQRLLRSGHPGERRRLAP